MKKRIGKFILLLLVGALLSVLWGCSFRPACAKTDDGKTLFRLGFSGAPDSLNPYDGVSEEAQAAFSLLFDRLFDVDIESGEIIPSLCTEYSFGQSATGATLCKLTLRGDVFWHDGEKLTASDVEFTLQSAKDYSALYGYPYCENLDTTGIAVEDDTHLSMIVWAGEEYVLQCLARIPILPRHFWNDLPSMHYNSSGVAADPARARFDLLSLGQKSSSLIGSGPYVFSGMENGICSLRENESYWREISGPEAVDLCFNVADPVQAVLNSEIDACWNMSLSAWKQLTEENGIRTSVGSNGEMYCIGFNFAGNSPVQDRIVRQAIDQCVNRQAILLRAFGGGYAEAGLISPFSRWHQSNIPPDERVYSPESAALLLDGAGIVDRDGDGIRELNNGNPLRLDLICLNGSAWETAAQILKSSCHQAGIGIEVHPLTALAYNESMASANYDIALSARQNDPEPYHALSAFYWDHGDNAISCPDANGHVSSRGWNESGYANEDYDILYAAMMNAEGNENISACGAEAASALYEDAAYISVGFSVRYQAQTNVWYGSRTDRSSGLYFTPLTLAQQLRGINAAG